MLENFIYQNHLSKNYNVIINGKNFYDQENWQQDKVKIILLNDDQHLLLDHYRLIAADLSRQKELDDDPKAIKQMEFVGQLKNVINADETQNMFILTVLEKIKGARLKFSQGSLMVI